MSRSARLIELAARQASISEHPRWKVGSVLLRGSSVIASSPNTVRNSPAVTQGIGSSFHAEERCLRKVFYQADRAEGTTIVVARIGRRGDQRLARPCLSCYTKLVEAGVSRIIYTLDGRGYGMERINR